MKKETALMRLKGAYVKTGKKHRAAYRMLCTAIEDGRSLQPAFWHRGKNNLFDLRDYTFGCLSLLREAHILFVYVETPYKCRNYIVFTHIFN